MAEPTKKEFWLKTTINELVDTLVAQRFPLSMKPEVVGVFTNQNMFAVCVHVTEPVSTDVALGTEEALWEALEIMLRFEEGYELAEYPDSKGIPTIGIGHRILPSDRQKYTTAEDGKLTMTPEQVTATFRTDTKKALGAAKKWLGPYWNTLSIQRQAVVVGMAFQMGENALADFGPTRQHIIRAEWEDVKKHFLGTKWFTDTPNRVNRMAEIMITGSFPDEYGKGK